MIVDVHEVEVRRVDEGVAVATKHTLDGGTLIRDRTVAVDHGDHVAAVLHERAEPSLTPVQLGSALTDALFEIGCEGEVLEQHRDLADHRQQDEDERVPSEEAPDVLPEGQPEGADHDGEADGHVRH